MFDRLFARVRPAHKYIIGAAWFFVVFSLLNLVWVVGSKLGSPAGPTSLYQTTVGDETYRAIGLNYTGVIGMMWAMLQGGVILTAAAGVPEPSEQDAAGLSPLPVLLRQSLQYFFPQGPPEKPPENPCRNGRRTIGRATRTTTLMRTHR